VDDQELAEYGHEEFLQALLWRLFNADALDQLCDDAGIPAPLDAGGQPVTISDARTYRDAGVLTRDRGVLVDLSDGSQFGLTVSVSRRPSGEVSLRAAGTRHHRPQHRSAGPGLPPASRGVGSCTCVCASGGFCGGCGHAGCGRR
jgi:hypothetical protein